MIYRCSATAVKVTVECVPNKPCRQMMKHDETYEASKKDHTEYWMHAKIELMPVVLAYNCFHFYFTLQCDQAKMFVIDE